MFPGRFLSLGLYLLYLHGLAFARDEDLTIDYDLLNNDDGQTPCDMENTVQARCSVSSRDIRTPLVARQNSPTPNPCTCSNLFFNLWSACIMSKKDNYTGLVSSDSWEEECRASSIEISSALFSDGRSSSPYPAWAYADMPKNSSFDILQAVNMALPENDKGSTWGTIQIVLPIIIGISVMGICAAVLLWYRRRIVRKRLGPYSSGTRKKEHSGSSFPLSLLPNMRTKVREARRDGSWVIDRHDEDSEDLVSSSFTKGTTSSTSRGHVRLPSSPSPPVFLDFSAEDGRASRQSLAKEHPKLVRNWYKLMSFLTPWKSKPVKVRSSSPDRRFDIDATNRSTKTDSTLENYRFGGFGGFRKQGRSQSSTAGPSRWKARGVNETTVSDDSDDDDDNNSDFSDHGPVMGIDDENGPLIGLPSPRTPPDQSSVLIISRGGRDFTIESGDTSEQQHSMEVVPPTPSHNDESLHWREEVEQPRSPKPQHIRNIRTPPAPQYPAPLPPVSPSRSPRMLPRPSIENMLDPSYSTELSSPPSRRQSPFSSRTPTPHNDGFPISPASPQFSVSSQAQSVDAYRNSPRASSSILPLTPPPPWQAHSRAPSYDIYPPPRPLPPSPRRPPENLPGPSRRPSSPSSDFDQQPYIASPPYRASPLPDENQPIRLERVASPDPSSFFPGPVRAAGYLGHEESFSPSRPQSPNVYPRYS